jgi:hypothetical protein
MLAGLISPVMLQATTRLPIAFALLVGGTLDICVAVFLLERALPRFQSWSITIGALASTLLLALLTIWSGLAAI